MKRFSWVLIITALSLLFTVNICTASNGSEVAETIGTSIVSAFDPEKVEVSIKNKTNEAWIEIDGGTIDGIKIKKFRLKAQLKTGTLPNLAGDDPKWLAEMIEKSVGEVTLSEKDVNEYFKKNKDADGFSDMRFDFRKEGFTAAGKFKTSIIVEVELPITAKGILSLNNDAVYMEKTVITVEGLNQPDFLTDMILSKINPLLEFKDIPFPVTFKEVLMTENEAIMTGNPIEFKGENIWLWKKHH